MPKLELPRGGGSLRSIGETFTPTPFSGAGALSIPLPLSPGRGGAGPQLGLSYSSGAGNGAFGLGFSLGLPSIARKTDKGIPRYHDGDESDVFVLAGAEDLVPLLGNAGWGVTQWGDKWGHTAQRVVRDEGTHLVYPYRPRVEGGFARIERWVRKTDADAYWRVVTPDNVESIFGRSADARVADPADPSRVFEWLLEETSDDRGNITSYTYKQEDLDAVDTGAPSEQNRLEATQIQAVRYPKRIVYGNGTPGAAGSELFEVVFDYGEHGTIDVPSGEHDVSPTEIRSWPVRQDVTSSHRAGFDRRTRRLCRRVLMFHHITALHTGPYLVASTDFTYDESARVTYLTGVTQRGYIRNAVSGRFIPSETPTLDLDYIRPQISSTIETIDAASLRNLPIGLDGAGYRLVDLDGEGIPGILTEQGGHWLYKRGNGDGSFREMAPVTTRPANIDLGSGAQLLDLDGDGQLELTQYDGPVPGFFERTADGRWNPLQSFKTVPQIAFDDPNVQFIDLTGDGRADVLTVWGRRFMWFRSKGKDGLEGPEHGHRPWDEKVGPTTLFGDESHMVAFADMTGDGLSDLVRIRNGEVAYWPNLGHGRFGRKITMAGAPVFDHPDQFRPDRIRLGDVDGTGPTDIVYLGRGETTVWFSQAGNGFDPAVTITAFPDTDDLSAVQLADFGTGTSSLVWSSPLEEGRPGRMRYVDLMGGRKPHLLASSNNNMGLRRAIQYAPSTRFYAEDRAAGRPWLTKLPFPVQVVERVETFDDVAQTKLVNHYHYHHGYYDGVEREFRGFALVEQWDTESFEAFGGTGLLTFDELETVEEDLHAPPVYTKSWFHTGAFIEGEHLATALRAEYFADALELEDTVLPSDLSPQEKREAARALKGAALRQEVYALDGTEPNIPYVVTESNSTVTLLQAQHDQRHAIFHVTARESLTQSFERNTADPRIAHAITLDVDAYGNPTRSAAIAYGRTAAGAEPEQSQRHIVITESRFSNVDDETTHYRIGTPIETRTYELTGLTDTTVPLAKDVVRDAVQDATEIPYEASPTTGLEKRLVEQARSLYWNDALTASLALGQAGQRALVYEQRQAAFTPEQVTAVFGSDVTTTILEDEGGYVLEDGVWWIPSGRPTFDALHFYLPDEVRDPFGNVTTITRDTHDLLVEDVTDPLGNVISSANDYRVLGPWEITDPNGNRQAVEFDGLGLVTAAAVMGKVADSDGDTLTDPTTTFEYDLFAWRDSGTPNWTKQRARERHADTQTPWQESRTFFDGSGRVILSKVQAEPGLAYDRDVNGDLVLTGGNPTLVDTSPDIRWVGSGRTVYDNKGNPVKQYEPYFSSIPDFEDEDELVAQGVTPVLHYDPLGRLVRTDFPNGTLSRVEFDAWVQRSYDPNDTVLASQWHTDRIDLTGPDPADLAEQRAAANTEDHDDTPGVTHFDSLGRPFLTEADLGGGTVYETRSTLDIEGNVLSVEDARGNVAETRVYGMAGRPLEVSSNDAGFRRTLLDIAGAPVRAWDSRGFARRVTYDDARRPLLTFVTPSGQTEEIVSANVYGETIGVTAVDDNLRGQLYRIYDGAGVVTNETFDFKGNLTRQTRSLATGYTRAPDWIDLDGETTISGMETAVASLLETEEFATDSTYDALNRIVTQTTPDTSVLQPSYGEGGLLDAVDVRVRGAVTATTYVDDIDYDAKGQRERITYGNGSVTTYEYDPLTFRLQRLRTTRTSDSAVMQDLHYHFDPVGNITEVRDDAQQTLYFDNAVVTPNQEFVYDALYRLTEASGREQDSLSQPSGSDFLPIPHPDSSNPNAVRAYLEQYVYDAVGNITEVAHMHGVTTAWTRRYEYASAGNRLLTSSLPADGAQAPYSLSYTHDIHGNMTAMPHLTAVDWDHADQMQHCDLGGGGDVYFTYDAEGQRVRKVQVNSSGTTVTERIYVGSFEVYRQTVSSTLQVERESLHVSDDTGRLAIVETLTVDAGSAVGSPTSIGRFQYGNHLGSAALELDDSAAVISYEEYHPYGTSSYRAKDSAIGVPVRRYRYTGKERDEETGLYYHGARYYAPWLGRWTAADPSGLGDGVNRWSYARSNPIRLSDPTGTAAQDPQLAALLSRQAELMRQQSTAPADELQRISDQLERVGQRVTQARAELDKARPTVGKELIRAASLRPAPSPTEGSISATTPKATLERIRAQAARERSQAATLTLAGNPIAGAVALGGFAVRTAARKAEQVTGSDVPGADLTDGEIALTALAFSGLATGKIVKSAGRGGSTAPPPPVGPADSPPPPGVSLESSGRRVNKVFRALRPEENPSVGLRARAPGANTEVGSQVMGKRESSLISTTKSKETALNKFGSEGQTVVEIDLSKVTGKIIDASGGVGAGRVRTRTRADQEVFIDDPGGESPPVPPQAIRVIRP